MRRLAILTLMLTTALVVSAQTTVPPAQAHVEGVVVDGVTGEPLADVTVMGPGSLSPAAGTITTGVRIITSSDIPKDLKTDAQGRFSIDVNSGQITLTATKTGYRPARLEGRKIPANNGIPLQLQPGQRQS